MTLRISTTTIESFRLYRDADFMAEAELQASIRGEFRPTREVLMGTALDAILESPQEYAMATGDAYTHKGIIFPGPVIRACLEHVDHSSVFQVKATKDYAVDGETVTVVAKLDDVKGTVIRERKSRWGAYEPDRYAGSYQWRYYLDIFEASSVVYVVFCLSEYESGEIALRDIETLPLYPYPALHSDCEDLLREFVAYVRLRGLERYLQPKEAA